MRQLPARLIQLAIRLYQLLVSPWLGACCRFHPTCSCYAHEAVGRFGALRGSWLALTRLARCHPWHEGGFDPVPQAGPRAPRTRAMQVAP